jgi:hypothetical protein
MIKQFKNSNPSHIIVLAGLTIALRIAFILHQANNVQQPFQAFLHQILVPHQYGFYIGLINNVIIAGTLIFIQALLFNLILNKYNILGKPTYLPALFFILSASVLSPFLTLSPALVANFFLLYSLNKLLASYKQPDAITLLFDIGLAIGLASILYFPLIVLMLWAWLCLIILRPFYWREWLSPLIAFLLIHFFLAVFYYYNEQLSLMAQLWEPLYSPIKTIIYLQPGYYLALLPLSVVLLLALVQLRLNFFKTFVLVRKTFIILLLLAFVLLFSFYLNPHFEIANFILLAIPSAILCAYYFLNASLKWIYETLFFSIILCALYFQWIA